MTFGQQSGPPAGARQIEALLERVKAAGYSDFREARHPLNLTQRQAAGRFTRDEADELLVRLERAENVVVARPIMDASTAATSKLLGTLPAESLAFELERRGWIVIAP